MDIDCQTRRNQLSEILFCGPEESSFTSCTLCMFRLNVYRDRYCIFPSDTSFSFEMIAMLLILV